MRCVWSRRTSHACMHRLPIAPSNSRRSPRWASAAASNAYGLQILLHHVDDDPDNVTLFALVVNITDGPELRDGKPIPGARLVSVRSPERTRRQTRTSVSRGYSAIELWT